MHLLITAWPKIDGEKRNPGDTLEVEDGLARMLIRDGQARLAGSEEPRQRGTLGPDHPDHAEEGPGKSEAGQQGSGEQTGEPVPAGKPGRSASKDELAAYAISQGMAQDRAQGMTRAELTAHIAST